MTNPLLTDAPLPAFRAIDASHVEPAIRQLLGQNRAAIATLLQAGADRWDTLVVPLERMLEGYEEVAYRTTITGIMTAG